MEHKLWKIISSTTVFEQSPWLRVISEDVELPDGSIVKDYLHLEALDFVMIVPVNREGEIGLIRSYKHGLRAIDIQPPAGYIDEDEVPLETAKRELLEEVGAISESWQPLGSYVIAGNRGAGTAHFFLAMECDLVAQPDPDDLELQEVLWIPIAQVQQSWEDGEYAQLSSSAILGLALSRLQDRK
jgi:ADP-ribose pyrophosphatase